MKEMQILAISGSLRKSSFNTALLQAAGQLAPEHVRLSIHDYSDVPLYNGDIADKPEGVVRLNEAIAAADGLLLAVPEYNYSLPGVLKNALDWASRPAYQSVFRNKPTGVMSAAASFVGGARGQQHTKAILLGMAAQVFPWPELLLPSAAKLFENGVLTDEATRRRLASYMENFADWVAKVK